MRARAAQGGTMRRAEWRAAGSAQPERRSAFIALPLMLMRHGRILPAYHDDAGDAGRATCRGEQNTSSISDVASIEHTTPSLARRRRPSSHQERESAALSYSVRFSAGARLVVSSTVGRDQARGAPVGQQRMSKSRRH